jgi:hypothetical protein
MNNTKYYSFSQIQSVKSNNFILPSIVIDAINLLNKVVVISSNQIDIQPVFKKNTYDDKHKSYKFNKTEKNIIDRRNTKSLLEDSWTDEKAIFNIKNAFIVTKIEPKEGLEKDINDIRISLNKISSKNYDSQKDIILQHMSRIDDEISLQKIAQFIFDIASSNKFYSELYADLYQELISISYIFKSILDEYVSTYKLTIDNIKYVDSEIDYDGYCSYVKENDKRRAMATLFMILSARDILDSNIMLSMIEYFQSIMLQYIELEGKSLECEEISEIIFILVSNGNSNSVLTSQDIWNNSIIPNVLKISQYKVKEHKSLTSRTVFKQLNLKDFLTKNNKK